LAVVAEEAADPHTAKLRLLVQTPVAVAEEEQLPDLVAEAERAVTPRFFQS
jgi:hypothetical protein